MLTFSQIAIVSLFTHGLLYGIYFATLTQCFRFLIFDDKGWKVKPRKEINTVMTLTTVFIFLMSTINHAASMTYYLERYFRRDVSRYKYGTMMAIDISENLAIISIDTVLIYRCWVVYAKSWRIICVPVTFWIASLACSVLESYYAGLYYKGQSHEAVLIAMKAITGLYACNIAITIYSTTVIICRIFFSTRNSGGNHRRLYYIMRILVESGALYTSMIIFGLVGVMLDARNDSTWVESLIGTISESVAFSTAGISFNLILIRVYQSQVKLPKMFADSSDDCVLSGNQTDNLQITASSEGPLSKVGWMRRLMKYKSTVEAKRTHEN